MAEIRGYTCDGGCGETTVVERVGDTVARNGWYSLHGNGMPSHFCSLPCLARWASAKVPVPTIGAG